MTDRSRCKPVVPFPIMGDRLQSAGNDRRLQGLPSATFFGDRYGSIAIYINNASSPRAISAKRY